jgi:AbiV family abortive infection protein
MAMVTGQSLLEGSAYAQEQCGQLLNDAAILLKAGSSASAVLLAAFAREELGRSRILFDLYLAVVENGESVTERDVQRKCADHVTRQGRGQLSIVRRADADTEAGKLMKTILSEKPLTAAYKEADAKLEEIGRRIAKRTPQERHATREEALYVDLRDGRWNRPTQKIKKDFAQTFLADAVNDYSVSLYGDPESSRNQAFGKWVDCPEFPTPPLLEW